MKIIYTVIALCFIVASCKKTETYTDEGKNYFPLTAGKQVVYDVDSIYYNDFTCTVDSFFHQMRWTVGDTFRDATNRLAYYINVDIRDNDSDVWKIHRVYAAIPTPSSLELTENNLNYIKLIFPVTENTTWKGNSKISTSTEPYQYLFDWDYTYENAGLPFDNGIQSFDNTVTVAEHDEILNDPDTQPGDYATKTFAKEVYAKDVGLIYREMTNWIYDATGSHCRSGFGIVMRAREHN